MPAASRSGAETASASIKTSEQLELWQNSVRAVDAILEERDRPPSAEDVRQFNAGWDAVVRQMRERKAPDLAIADIERQARRDRESLMERLRADDERRVAAEIVLIPARQIPPLSEMDIEAGLTRSVALADRRAAIERSVQLVYGKEASTLAVKLWTRAARSPQEARLISGRLLSEPERFGAVVGRASTALRSEDEARQSARAELPRLADAIEDYGATADRERRKLVEDHALYQHRHAQAVRLSRSVETLLEAPPPEQERRLNASKSLSDELARLQAGLERRLTLDDRLHARMGKTAILSQALEIGPTAAKAAATVYQKVAGLRDRQALSARTARK